jgi:hypothetical protein
MRELKINYKILFIIIFFIHSLSYGKTSGDLDGNGVINLVDCLQLLHKIAYSAENIPVNLIAGKHLISGTYSQIKNSEKTTYTFSDDGACVRVGPDDYGKDMTTEGTWHYENESLHINTSGEIAVFAATFQINIDEFYEAAFTNKDGTKLIMAAPGKPIDKMPDILGRYTGGGEVNVTLPKMSLGNRSIIIESIVDVKSDGSWQSTVTIETNDRPEVEQYQGQVDPSYPTIYTFGSYFYPDFFSNNTDKAYYDRE